MANSDEMINRDEERAGLQTLLGDGVPRLALVYGRRRVGKTHLLNRTWPRNDVFYFTASETTEEQNRALLPVLVGTCFGFSAYLLVEALVPSTHVALIPALAVGPWLLGHAAAAAWLGRQAAMRG